MNPQIPFFLTNHIQNLELHPKLKQLLLYTLTNKKPPKELFDEISYHYYNSYVKTKMTRILKDKNSYLEVYISPSYLLYRIALYNKQYERTYYYHYLFGIDNDKVFANRALGAPDTYQIYTIRINDNIELRFTRDDIIYNIMGYNIDLGDREEITIENIPLDQFPSRTANIRIQGDIVLQLEPLDDSQINRYIGANEILNHVTILMIDLINRILIDHRLSTRIIDNTIYLPSVAPRKKDIYYLAKLVSLLRKELKEILGKEEVESYVDEYHTLYEITVKSTYNCRLTCFIEGGGYGNAYNHIGIRVNCLTYPPEPALLTRELLNEIKEAINNTPPSNYEFNIGNHFIRLTNVKSLSFSFRPSKQPITLNEHLINIRNPRTFIVFPNSVLELQHPEHGLKVVKFKNSYIVRFTHVEIDQDFTRERNRIILRYIQL